MDSNDILLLRYKSEFFKLLRQRFAFEQNRTRDNVHERRYFFEQMNTQKDVEDILNMLPFDDDSERSKHIEFFRKARLAEQRKPLMAETCVGGSESLGCPQSDPSATRKIIKGIVESKDAIEVKSDPASVREREGRTIKNQMTINEINETIISGYKDKDRNVLSFEISPSVYSNEAAMDHDFYVY